MATVRFEIIAAPQKGILSGSLLPVHQIGSKLAPSMDIRSKQD
jgi:hypothetical protein